MTNGIHSTINRYIIEKEIGRGGMAVVYKAYDPELGRTVAIKLIRSSGFSDDQTGILTERFRREAKALAKLDHPNIVKVLDYGEFDGSNYLVMEFLEGMTLKEIRKPLPVDVAVQLIRPIVSALRYVHRQGILHRDIKPSNMMFTKDRVIKLTDFGIAKWLDPEADMQTLTETGLGIGTPEYMAPEQGLGRKVDERADMYSLAIVFYELVTGHKPFQGPTPMAVLAKQATDPIPDPRAYVSELNKSVVLFLAHALAKNPDDRYATISDFVRDLDGLRLQAVTELKGKSNSATRTSGSGGSRQSISEAEVQRALTLSGGRKDRIPPSSGRVLLSKWPIGAILVGLAILIFSFVKLNQDTLNFNRKVFQSEQTNMAIATQLAETISAFDQQSAALATAIAGVSAADAQAMESFSKTAAYLEHQSAQIQTAAALITAISDTQIPEATRQALISTATAFQAGVYRTQGIRYETELASVTQAVVEGVEVVVVEPSGESQPADTPVLSRPQTTATPDEENPFENVKTGDVVTFGSYEQDNDLKNGTEPIEWRLLKKEGSMGLFISRRVLDAVDFYHPRDAILTDDYCDRFMGQDYIPWADSDLRQWLNHDFIGAAFNSSEKKLIIPSKIENHVLVGSDYNTNEPIFENSKSTEDGVFVLSYDEANLYFKDDRDRISFATEYAIAKGVKINQNTGEGWWWLRSPGMYRPITQVNYNGDIIYTGMPLCSESEKGGVRPAMWVRIDELPTSSTSPGLLPVGDGIIPEDVWLPGGPHGKNPEDDVTSPDANFKPGDIAYIGLYRTADYTDSENLLEWRVLDVQGNRALIILPYGLDGLPYHQRGGEATWETSSIRAWLNGEFYNTAFGNDEKSHILLTEVINTNNPENGNDAGNDTQDKIFLLSYNEASKYYRNTADRFLAPSSYAATQGVWFNPENSGTNWWLRTPGHYPNSAMYIDDNGEFSLVGALTESPKGAVRPAMWVRFGN